MAAMDNEISIYLSQIGKIPMLSHEEQKELAAKAQKGDLQARNKLVNANLRFVVNTAKAYQNHGLELIDLISEGNIGLIQAISKFDTKKDIHFITYAVWWIRQSILKAISETGRAIRLPQHKTNAVAQFEKAKQVYEVSDEEQNVRALAEKLGMSDAMIKELMLLTQEMASLDAVSEGTDKGLGEILADEKNLAPEDEAINEVMKDDIEAVMGELKPAEQKVLKLRYGLSDGKERSLSEVGKICGLTKERIRQIEQGAFARMRSPSKAKRLTGYIAA